MKIEENQSELIKATKQKELTWIYRMNRIKRKKENESE